MKTKELKQLLQDVNSRWQLRDDLPDELVPIEKFGLGYDPGTEEIALVERESQAVSNFNKVAAAPREAPESTGSFDWRSASGTNFLTPVKNQGTCGSCVAFATLAAVEAMARIEQQNPSLNANLSEAELFYCHAANEGRTCANGWYITSSLRAVRDRGVVSESIAPYSPTNPSCPVIQDRPNRITRIATFTQLNTVAEMIRWIRDVGPVVSAFSVYTDFYEYWRRARASDVYEHQAGSLDGGHAISVVGYNSDQRFWICKNSWGTSGGDRGYFKIAFGECGIDAAMWGVRSVTLGAPAAAPPDNLE